MKLCVIILLIAGTALAAEDKELYRKAKDPRCSFNYYPPKETRASFHEALRKKAGLSKKEFDRELKNAGPWLDYVYNSTPYVMKKVSTPKFLIGRLLPQYGADTKSSYKGIPLNTIFLFDGDTQVRFPNHRKVPCSWVMIHPKKWKMNNGILDITDAEFTPSRVGQ